MSALALDKDSVSLWLDLNVSVKSSEWDTISIIDNISVNVNLCSLYKYIIYANGFFNCNLFDKRDDFKFKVINYPCLNFSNIPFNPLMGFIYHNCYVFVGFVQILTIFT